MSFQVRHKEFGVFQGDCLGLGFWYPMSHSPEQGYFEFFTKEEAQAFIDFVCDIEKLEPLKQEDLSIEDFDEVESNRLIQGSICYG